MRKLIRKVVEGYKSLKLEGQEGGFILYTGQEADSKQAVSIKVLPRLLDKDPQIAARFRGLAQTIRQLNHPNIAAVRKVGEESGLPYLVTRAIEKGRPLAARLDQPWAVDMTANVVMQVGQALEHAYNKGIVHGSLSPESIVVQDNGRAMVTDFGLAELQNLVGVQLKQAASPYLAPERAAGEPVDARADVYALGAVLYTMLTQRDPQRVQGQVLPPSRFNPDVPPAMDEVVGRALASDPAARYPDVRSFLTAFGAITVAPMVKKTRTGVAQVRCTNCGASNQAGRFCRRCGTRLEQPRPTPQDRLARSKLDQPIQVTKVDVGHVEVGTGIEIGQGVIARPMPVATEDLADQFPAPLEMPKLDTSGLWAAVDGEQLIAMPEPLAMPVIDWEEVAPPMPQVPTIEDTHKDANP